MRKAVCVMFMLCLALSAGAMIWHVNNVPSMSADFTDIPAAIAATEVVDGDTLYIYGSPLAYTNAQVNKQLTLIGPGYFLGENQGLQHNPTPATISQLTLASGAAGSVVAGLQIAYMEVLDVNCVVQRDLITRMYVAAANCMVLQCYISTPDTYTIALQAVSAPNLLLANSFVGYGPAGWSVNMDDNCGGVVYNCVIKGSIRLRDAEVYNCIVFSNQYGWEYGWDMNANCSFHNNVFGYMYSWDWTNYVSGTSNVCNTGDQIFMGTVSTDAQWQLCPGSPAHAYGVGGTDCGMFGGQTPYKLSGIPAIPTIYQFFAPATGFTIPIELRARSNN